MIKVYVSRFDREVDSEPHLECYEIEQTPQMKNMMPTSALEAHVEQDSAVPAEYYLMEMGLLHAKKI